MGVVQDAQEDAEDGSLEEHAESSEMEYKTASQIAGILHRSPKTIKRWIHDFKLGRRQGVYAMPGSYLIHWPTFEREFVQRMGPEGTAVEEFVEAVNDTMRGRRATK